jgi:hypothetical protein
MVNPLFKLEDLHLKEDLGGESNHNQTNQQ